MANESRDRRGTWLGMPYDWRKPSKRRLKERSWNAEDRRVFTPKSFGWGYGINFRSLLHKLTGR